jgi:hypothetical protein
MRPREYCLKIPLALLAKDLALQARHPARVLLVQLIGTEVSKSEERNLESRAKRALYLDPHLRSSPLQGEGKRGPVPSIVVRRACLVAMSSVAPLPPRSYGARRPPLGQGEVRLERRPFTFMK